MPDSNSVDSRADLSFRKYRGGNVNTCFKAADESFTSHSIFNLNSLNSSRGRVRLARLQSVSADCWLRVFTAYQRRAINFFMISKLILSDH